MMAAIRNHRSAVHVRPIATRVAGHLVEQINSGIVRGRIISIPAIGEPGDVLGRKSGEYWWDEPQGYNYGELLRARRSKGGSAGVARISSGDRWSGRRLSTDKFSQREATRPCGLNQFGDAFAV